MTDYRNLDPDFHNPENNSRRDPMINPDASPRNTAWGWVAAAVFIVAILAVRFGIWGKPQSNGMNTAFNESVAGGRTTSRRRPRCRHRRWRPAPATPQPLWRPRRARLLRRVRYNKSSGELTRYETAPVLAGAVYLIAGSQNTALNTDSIGLKSGPELFL